MSSFFINSSEILTVSLLNSREFYFNQEELGKCIGCTQPNISYVIGSLAEKGIVENSKGFVLVNQYLLIEELTRYADDVFSCDFFLQDRVLKVRNITPEALSYFKNYFRIFNIDYVITECEVLNEICFIFSANVIDLRDLDF